MGHAYQIVISCGVACGTRSGPCWRCWSNEGYLVGSPPTMRAEEGERPVGRIAGEAAEAAYLALMASFAWPLRCGDDEPAGCRLVES